MTREIKFRGLTIKGEWVYGLLAHTESIGVCKDKGWFISNEAGAPFAYQVRPETIGQSTGLKDKNGKEIYEGDIFKTENDYIGDVGFHRGKFDTLIKPQGSFHNKRIEDLDFSVDMGIEIIGNIYKTQCPECGEDCGTEGCTQQQRQHTAQVDADERKDK